LEERLAKLEGRVEELSKRVDDLRNDMNHRFAELSKRIDDLKWFFYITWGVTWGLLIAMLSLLIR
jgi:tetrahydromethanopterin S-methyltransferase subunit G